MVEEHGIQHRFPTRAILVICCIAQFIVVLDVVIVTVALPQMRDSLGLSVAGQQWVVNAYTLTFAGFLMLGRRAADLFGRRRVSWSALGFSPPAALFGCLAQTGSWLIAARAPQGVGGAILAPATSSILVTTESGQVDPGEFRSPVSGKRDPCYWFAAETWTRLIAGSSPHSAKSDGRGRIPSARRLRILSRGLL
jgi:hypothetical protein